MVVEVVIVAAEAVVTIVVAAEAGVEVMTGAGTIADGMIVVLPEGFKMH